MKKALTILFLVAISFATKISAQTNTETSKTFIPSLPADFPKYVNTGNPETDRGTYIAAKYSWLQRNKQVYLDYVNLITDEHKKNGVVNLDELEENQKLLDRIEMSETQRSGPLKISREYFNSLPLEKQNLYLAEPNKYIIAD